MWNDQLIVLRRIVVGHPKKIRSKFGPSKSRPAPPRPTLQSGMKPDQTLGKPDVTRPNSKKSRQIQIKQNN
jgi:hypothetical protein